MLAAEWGTGEVLFTMMSFFLFVLWIWLVIAVFTAIFRNPNLSGGGKALWSIFVILLPFIGIFAYLIVHGKDLAEASYQPSPYGYTASAAPRYNSEVEQLTKLASLRAEGVIDEAEFQRMKAKVTTA